MPVEEDIKQKGTLLKNLEELQLNMSGELRIDALHQRLYATDASVYRMLPIGVAFPQNKEDIQKLIAFAKAHKIGLIPRTAGTSLAGQCVGDGLVVDVSKHFTATISLNTEAKTVTVQPGVIRDELNRYLEPYNLFFGPNTSTSNRCMIGGMVGNNSSGTTSIQYGVTRDKVLRLEAILSDGSEVVFENLPVDAFSRKRKQNDLEGKLYQELYTLLQPEAVRKEIKNKYPKPEIHRRNTGYALDALINNSVFDAENEAPFNFCKLLTGSEGTLAFTTAITLQLDDLPPAHALMVAAHFTTLEACLRAVVPAMQHDLYACEMMDKIILDCTLNNREQQKNRFFIEDDPKAILMLEIRSHSEAEVVKRANALIADLQATQLTYAMPVLQGAEINQALELRKAGLGLLGNIVGDRKAVACIEDTAVAVADLADYIAEFSQLMQDFGQEAVYYAHAGAGELHLRPILNLKKGTDVKLFREITAAVAQLVKKYGGSFSGEHGNGMMRAEWIPFMLGEKNYEIIKQVKTLFDSEGIFNPGKIVDAFPMDKNLRYEVDRKEPAIKTLLNFDDAEGILKLTEKCNGSGDCRKLPEAGGTMCPSYRATRNESDTTRGRANTLREFLTTSEQKNKFNQRELKTVFDLCLSCKACSSECPSNVDVATLKAEFQYQYKKENGSTLRDRVFAYNGSLNKLGSFFPSLTNALYVNKFTSSAMKSLLHVAKERQLPSLSGKPLTKKIASYQKNNPLNPIKSVVLFVDEFTNFLDGAIGEDAIILLQTLRYEVKFVKHPESGRSFISKGFLKEAQKVAEKNAAIFSAIITADCPLIGIEPSAILGFRDEYPRLVRDVAKAKILAKNTYVIDEFLANEIKAGNIKSTQFTTEAKTLKIHGHCHQKSLSTMAPTFEILNLPVNYKPTIIPSGCCGMAGSFGYEEEHYAISMQIGEQTLFPAVRKASVETIIVAPGTSCRHQIKDGTQRIAVHPVTVLRQALV